MINEKTFNKDENESMIVLGLDTEMVNSSLMGVVHEDDPEAALNEQILGYFPEGLPDGLTYEDLRNLSEDPREY